MMMNICRINRYVYLLIAVTSLAACTSTVETSKPSASKFEENTGILREGKKLKGIPYPEFSYVLVEGVLTKRPGAEKCLPTRVTQRQFQPTGEVLLVKMPIRPWTVFADSELSVEFFNNGLPKLISANSKNAATALEKVLNTGFSVAQKTGALPVQAFATDVPVSSKPGNCSSIEDFGRELCCTTEFQAINTISEIQNVQ